MKKTVCLLLIFILTFSCAFADGQVIRDYMLSNYTKALSLSPLSSFNGYCAACVAYQGMAMGIHKGYVWCNGNEAFDTYSSMAKTSGGWLTKSHKASDVSMRQVLLSQNADAFDVPYSPIVLGFNTGTATDAGQTYGHAMMIYAVRCGMVYFADSTEPVLSDNIHTLSIDDFCAFYSDKADTERCEFRYDGAVIFYTNAPKMALISASCDEAVLWQNIELSFSSPSATSYSIGIDREGKRISTIHTDKPFYNLSFGEQGTYTIYISACNTYGYTDSIPISIKIV